MAFSFGSQNKPAFGATTTPAAGGFGGFGAAANTTGAATGFSSASTGTGFNLGGGFGTNTTSSQPTFGFGSTTTTSAAGFGGGASTGTGFNLGGGFGTNTTSSQPTFGFGSTTTTSAAGFGGGFGFGGTSTATGTGNTLGSGFGLGSSSTLDAGGALTRLTTQMQQQQQLLQQQQQQQGVGLDNAGVAKAVTLPTVLGDERDATIAKWNQLQAFWGTGKGYFTQQGQHVNFNPENLFCRFKAVGFSCIPTCKNEDGLVVLVFNKPLADIQGNQQQVVDTLQRIIASGSASLSVCVETVKGLPEDRTEMVLFLQERSPTGSTRRIPALDVFKAIQGNAGLKQQLGTHLSVENMLPKTGLSKEQLKQYLDTAPAGIDRLIWQQAKLDNPDPDTLIPVPMIGFTELHNRLKHQEQQTKLHQSRLDIIASDIAHLQRNHTETQSKMAEYKRRHLELGHRVLQVMVKQEIARKTGYAIQADEEQLRTQLEAIQAELNAPTRFKGRLNELMSQLRMQNQLGAARADGAYQMEGNVQQELRQHLKQQQEGLGHLISIIKDDLEDLKLIEHGLAETPKHGR